jgi:hypothetical protein
LNDLAEYEDFDSNDPETWGEHNTPEVQRHWPLYEATDGGKKLDADPTNWPDELPETIEGQELSEIIDEPADNIANWPLEKRQRNEAQKLADELADFDPTDADSAVENYLSEAKQEDYGEAHDNYSGILADDPGTWPEEHQDRGHQLLQAARKSANDPAATTQQRDTAREAFFDYRKTQIAPIVAENRAKFEALEQKALAAAKEHFAPKQARYDALEKSAVEAAQQRVDALRKSGDERVREAARIVEAASGSAEAKAKEYERLTESAESLDDEGGDASDADSLADIGEHDALMRRLRAAVGAAKDDSGILFATAPTPEVAPLGQRIMAAAKETLNLPRAIMSSMDVSAVLRQGGFIGLGNPKRALESIGPMFRALASEESYQAQAQAILARPNAPLYKEAKLYIAETGDVPLSAKEESIMSALADKIPGVKASNRAYVTFLNKLRADSFDAMAATLTPDGAPTKPEMEAIANFINVATGRGNMGSHAAAAETLATVFFSPRLMLSRFQILAGQPMYRGTARTRKLIAREYAKFLIGVGVVLGLGALAGATVEKDPRSSDFGKLRFGNTRLDPLGGLAQVSVLLSRLGTGETKKMDGSLVPIRGENVPYGSGNSADLIARFLRTKLSPVVGAGVDLLSGKSVVGEPVKAIEGKKSFPFVGGTIPSLLMPLGFRDIYDVMQEQGATKGTALTLLSLFGMGLQQYDPSGGAETKMRQIAAPFRTKAHPGDYAPLRGSLVRKDRQGAEAAIRRLLTEGRPLNQIGRAFGVGAQGKFVPEHFTGGAESERMMLAKLDPEQKRLYLRAQGERRASAEFFKGAAASVLRSPKMEALASRNAQRARQERMAKRPTDALAGAR